MVLLVTEVWWPASKSEQVGKLYLEVMQKYPEDNTIAKPIIRSAVWVAKDGMHALAVYSIKPGKVKEAMDISYNRLLMLSSIEGYQSELNIAYDLVEAMPLVGLKAP